MLKDAESIEFSISEESVNDSWQPRYLREDSVKERINWRRVIQKFVSWRVFKTIVFILSLLSVVIQSMEFFKIYYKYPTNIVLETTVEKEFKLPAVTMCFLNTMSTEVFCRFNSKLCEKPNNLEEFCKKHPIYCRGDVTNLKIPMTGYYTNYAKELRVEANNHLLYEHFNDKKLYEVTRHGNTPLTRTFIFGSIGLLKCYSENLHLYQSNLKLETSEIDFNSSSGFRVMSIQLNLHKIKLFYDVNKPQVFIGIHSPFVPNNPTFYGQAISPGNTYEFQVELMCLELCKSEFSTKVYDCNMALTMISSILDLCFSSKSGKRPRRLLKPLKELKKERQSCMQDCKPECLKLQYKYKMAIKDLRVNGEDPNDFAQVNIFVKNTEVTVLRHVPLYGSGETFSYIGGLAGFWLGVSVFMFTDTIEKLWRKAVLWKMSLKMDNAQNAPTSDIHLD